WDASAASEPGNDEYQAALTAPAPGTWDHAFRFSRDGGASWLYCDRDARGDGRGDGAEDGYMPEDAGNLVTFAGPCTDNPCAGMGPMAACDGDGVTVVGYAEDGVCVPDGADYTCEFEETRED